MGFTAIETLFPSKEAVKPHHGTLILPFSIAVVFMGSEKYPGDNTFDVLTNRYGGYDNAFTDYERVCIYVCVLL